MAAADIENLAQRELVQLGAGRQPLIDDRLENMRVDVVGTLDLRAVEGIAEADQAALFARSIEHLAPNLSAGLRAINAKH